MKGWLSQVEQLLEAADGTQQRIAFALGGSLRTPLTRSARCRTRGWCQHRRRNDVQVWQGKGDKFRETPVVRGLATIDTIDDYRAEPASSVLVEITSMRSLRRWVRSSVEKMYEETEYAGWSHLGFHDLRRTWATALASADVDPLLVCDLVDGTTVVFR